MNEHINLEVKSQLYRNYEILDEFRREKRFCDVTLLVDGVEMFAHKCVLAAGSKYFASKFHVSDDDHTQTSSMLTRFRVDHKTTHNIMSTIIDYLYTGKLEYSECDRMLLLENLNNLEVDCGPILQNFINNDNCFQMYTKKETICGVDFKTIASRHILANLEVVNQLPEFNQLSFEELHSILSLSTSIDVAAIKIIETILSWIDYDQPSRAKHFGELISFVQLDELSADEIKNHIIPNLHFRNSANGCKWLVNGLMAPHSGFAFSIEKPTRLYILSRGAEQWMRVLTLNEHRVFDSFQRSRPKLDSFSITSYKNYIYAVGGKRHCQIVNIGLRFDTVSEQWREFLCPIGKAGCGVCTLKTGQMMVMGGVIGSNSMKTCSCYDYDTNKWVELRDMAVRRCNPTASICNSAVYAMGGSYTADNTIVERYDHREGAWYNAGTIPVTGGAVSARLGQNIFCVEIGTKTLYNYDVRNLQVQTVPSTEDVRYEWIMPADSSKLFFTYRCGIVKMNPNGSYWDEIYHQSYKFCHTVMISN